MPKRVTSPKSAKQPSPTAAMKKVASELSKELPGGRAVFDKLVERIARLRRDGDQEWDTLWETVQQVTEGEAPLFRLRYKTLKAFVDAHLPGESPRSVQRNSLVAGCFTPADLTRHGVAWLEAAALYAQALAGAKRPPKAIDLDRLKVAAVTRDGDHRARSARDCDLGELRAARRKLEGGAKRPKAGPKEVALREALGKRRALHGVTVSARPEEVGLGAIPWAELPALGAVLVKVKLPAV